VSPAKAAINSDRAIAEKLTGVWLPCQESSALQRPAQSNYRLKAEEVGSTGLKLQIHEVTQFGSLSAALGAGHESAILAWR
jgi:hypothetical protein